MNEVRSASGTDCWEERGMQIIKNAAGKWLIEATDSELLFLNAKVQEKVCPIKCPFGTGCINVRHCCNMRLDLRIKAEEISKRW